MATYFVFIPGTEQPTAEIDAPDTRHARTVYLDYLSRSSKIPYSARGKVRKLVKVNRMQPGEVRATLQLSYGERSMPTQEMPVLQPTLSSPQSQGRYYSDESGRLMEEGAQGERPIVGPRDLELTDEMIYSQGPLTKEKVDMRSSQPNPMLSPIMRLSKVSRGT